MGLQSKGHGIFWVNGKVPWRLWSLPPQQPLQLIQRGCCSLTSLTRAHILKTTHTHTLCCYSVAKSYPTLCNSIDCSMPGSSVLHYLLEFAQTHVHWVNDAIQPSHPLLPPLSFCPQSLPASGFFPMSRLFASGGQRIGTSASASVLPMNIQGWFPLG